MSLFDQQAGRLMPELAALAPTRRAADGRQPAHQRRAAAARPAPARLPRLRRGRARPRRRATASDTFRRRASFLRDVLHLAETAPGNTFRIFGPDETLSNRLEAVFEATNRQWDAATAEPTTSFWRLRAAW